MVFTDGHFTIEASLSGVAVEQAAISEETEGREEDNKQEQGEVM